MPRPCWSNQKYLYCTISLNQFIFPYCHIYGGDFLKKNFWGGNNSKKSENCVGGPKSGITKFGNFWKGLVRKGLCHADFTQWEWGGATKHSGMGINFRDYVLSNMSLTSKLHFSDLQLCNTLMRIFYKNHRPLMMR